MNETIKLNKLEAYLSNERTLLSYIRTAASAAVLAVAMFKFFESKIIIYVGFGILVISLLVFILGLYRYFQQRKRITHMDLN